MLRLRALQFLPRINSWASLRSFGEDVESAVQEKRSIPAIWFYISILVEILEHAVVTFRGCVRSDG